MLEKLSGLIKNNSKFVITSHVNPDGDSIGSEIALFRYLNKLGKKQKSLITPPLPRTINFWIVKV